jgi:hypothetical protein
MGAFLTSNRWIWLIGVCAVLILLGTRTSRLPAPEQVRPRAYGRRR